MPFRRRRVTEYGAVQPPRPGIWPWLALLAVLVVGGILGAYFLMRDDASSAEKATVPNVVGLSTSLALEKLGQRGYSSVVRGRVTSGTTLGTVLSQAPTPGADLDKGGQVTIVVARGPSTLEVPNVVGLTVDQAFERLEAAHLKGRSVKVSSPQPVTRVIRQAPAGGSQAKKGSRVLLTISKGPRSTKVPSVVGQTESAATATLGRLGFRMSISRVSATQPKGIVVAQSPVAGARVKSGSIVGLNVSQGQSATGSGSGLAVPNVVGLSQRVAVARIERAGLGVDSFPKQSGRPQGTVVSQVPAAGTRAVPGSEVRIDVSLGPGPRGTRTVPNVVNLSEAAAKRKLIVAGFTVQSTHVAVGDPSKNNVVVKQSPKGGGKAPTGSQVIISVGASPATSD